MARGNDLDRATARFSAASSFVDDGTRRRLGATNEEDPNDNCGTPASATVGVSGTAGSRVGARHRKAS